jgi:hypothetical protein
MQPMADNVNQRLRKDYKGAFDEWALEVSRLQEVSGSGDSSHKQQAEERVAAAEVLYRARRDRLADDMSSS